MTSRTSGFIRLVMGLLVGVALVTSCGGDSAPQAEVGELTVTLASQSPLGVDYQLRDALFLIRGLQDEDVSSEDYPPEQPVISVSLASGSYQVTLQDGWRMEYSANGQAFADIPATLVSPNPADVTVVFDEVTPLTLLFEVDGRLISFGPGILDIDFTVTETDPTCEDVSCEPPNPLDSCRISVCDPADGICKTQNSPDGTSCKTLPPEGLDGLCQAGLCIVYSSIFPCTEGGIHAAIAQGGGPHAFACEGPTTVTIGTTIAIDNDVILDGIGNLTVDGNQQHGVFSIGSAATVELRRLAVTGGIGTWGPITTPPTREGGGIYVSSADLTLTEVSVSENTAAAGGGITNRRGTVTLIDSTVSENTATQGNGGGIYNTGTVTLSKSTLADNHSVLGGGGVYNVDGALTLSNSTVSGNTSDDVGGGIMQISTTATLTLENSTIAGNDSSQGGAMWVSGLFVANNSILDGFCDIPAATPTTGTNNIDSPFASCQLTVPGNQVLTAAQLNLGPLQDNGGPVLTHAPQPGSFAIDAVPLVDCLVATDQRGVARPQGLLCDVGSVEVQP
jgi:predicted outer membrane repeat protein